MGSVSLVKHTQSHFPPLAIVSSGSKFFFPRFTYSSLPELQVWMLCITGGCWAQRGRAEALTRRFLTWEEREDGTLSCGFRAHPWGAKSCGTNLNHPLEPGSDSKYGSVVSTFSKWARCAFLPQCLCPRLFPPQENNWKTSCWAQYLKRLYLGSKYTLKFKVLPLKCMSVLTLSPSPLKVLLVFSVIVIFPSQNRGKAITLNHFSYSNTADP